MNRLPAASGAAAAMYAPVGYPQTYAPLKERAAPMFNLEKTLNLKPVGRTYARGVEIGLISFFTAVGLLHEDPSLWFRVCGEAFFWLCFGSIVIGGLFQLFVMAVGTKIQDDKAFRLDLVAREILVTVKCMYLVSTFVAWPLTQARMGHPTAVVDDIFDAVPFARELGLSWTACILLYQIKFVGIILGADLWSYVKHRSLHSRTLWAFHKAHHQFHDPTVMAGFAHHSVETTATFLPILLFCNSSVGVYGPMHWPMLTFMVCLNYYMHCGYRLDIVEKYFPLLYLNTSNKHNRHHEKTINNYGEIAFFWDVMFGTSGTVRRILPKTE